MRTPTCEGLPLFASSVEPREVPSPTSRTANGGEHVPVKAFRVNCCGHVQLARLGAPEVTEVKEPKKFAPHTHAPPAVEFEKAGHATHVELAVPPPITGWYVFAGQLVQVDAVVEALAEYVFAAQGVQTGGALILHAEPAAAMKVPGAHEPQGVHEGALLIAE